MMNALAAEVGLVIVEAVLRGTATRVTFVLTTAEYTYYQFLRGQCVDESAAIDQDVLPEIRALVEHLEM